MPQSGWTKATVAEKNNIQLKEAKEAKIKELKKNRDTYLVSDYISHQATELVEDEDGDFTNGELVYFSFKAGATGNPASEPNSILLGAVLMGSANPSYFLRYSCTIIEGESTRKGYVKITPAIAAQLIAHIQDRNLGAIKLTNNREKAINVASTIEEINAIDITF